MTKNVIRALRCKNYERHIAEEEKHPELSVPLFIRDDMAVAYGWKKIEGEWLCSECMGRLDKTTSNVQSKKFL